MENVNFNDIAAYMNLLEERNVILSDNNQSDNMDLDEIDDQITKLEDFKAVIDDKIVSLQAQRTKRMKNVKMLRKIPLKNDQIAC